jgi:tRNA A37 methylthiotransferase MiaB
MRRGRRAAKKILNGVRISACACLDRSVRSTPLDTFERRRLMPHLHLSLRAGDDLILKRMKRRHRRADAIAFCERLRRLRPDVVFGGDIIAGFPTETEAMFARSLDLVDECGLTQLHVFPFSPRPGTPAARMPRVAGEAIKDRARRLREKGALWHLDPSRRLATGARRAGHQAHRQFRRCGLPRRSSRAPPTSGSPV